MDRCIFCGFEGQEIEVRRHESACIDNWYICPICPSSFQHESELEEHKLTEHFGHESNENSQSEEMAWFVARVSEIRKMRSLRNSKKPNLNKKNQTTDTHTKKITRIPSRRCNVCVGCTASNCLECVECLDMKKYGGPGNLRRGCSKRKCIQPKGRDIDDTKPTTPNNILNQIGDTYIKMIKTPIQPNLDIQNQTANTCTKGISCPDCTAPNCGECVPCLDSLEFGGAAIRRRACDKRKCIHIQPKGLGDPDDRRREQGKREQKPKQSREEKLEKNKEYYDAVLGPKVKCEDCAVIINQGRMMNHKKEHHNPNIPEGCLQCGYRALTKKGIKDHVAKWHSDHLKTIPCTFGCGYYSVTQQKLRYHIWRSCKLSPQADKYKAELDKSKVAKRLQDKKMAKKKMYKELGIEAVLG